MISVIVPVYNASEYLPACVESILKQDHSDWELILVDDDSTDGSSELVDSYAAKDERIRALHPGHGGAAAARNRGVEAARGEYICFIDSDDTVEPDYLSYMYKGAKLYDADIVCCGHDEPKDTAVPAKGGEEDFTFCSLEDLLYQRGLMSVPWGYLYRRSLWDTVRFPEGTEAEDMGTIYRLFMNAGKAVKGGRICYHYIQRSSSTVYATAASRRKAYYLHSRRMLKQIHEERPALHRAALSRHFSICAQALSETSVREKGAFVKRVYSDMSAMSKYVREDKYTRRINRIAAYLMMMGPVPIHLLLRAFYYIKIWRMKNWI